MGLLLLFLFGAMAVSFLCSVLESVLMSTSLSYINLREEEGYAPAALMSKYKDDTGRPLAAILSLNTIANTIGAAGVGMQAAAIAPDNKLFFGLVSAMTTILILVFAEIIPKVIGTTYWRELMGFTARTIRALIFILYPFVLLVELITRMFPDNEDDPSVSREEVLAMVNVGEEEGVVDEDENKIFSNLMRLDSIHAYDVTSQSSVRTTVKWLMRLRILPAMPRAFGRNRFSIGPGSATAVLTIRDASFIPLSAAAALAHLSVLANSLAAFLGEISAIASASA